MANEMRAEVEAAAHWLSSTFIPGADEADLKETFGLTLQALSACRTPASSALPALGSASRLACPPSSAGDALCALHRALVPE